jgi:hypothetical protein
MTLPRTSSLLVLVFGLPLAAIASCNSGPAAVRQPSINAASAGRLAIEQYDTNGDRRVAGDELEQAPALRAALPRLDTDSDAAVTADEIAGRVMAWKGMVSGLMSFSFSVTLDGSPLANATVTFEPEAFLGEEIKPAVGVTNEFGGGGATIPKELRPDPTSPPGMHLGLYKVKISKTVGGKEIIPRQYNEETILGQEVAYDVPEISGNRLVYALKSK